MIVLIGSASECGSSDGSTPAIPHQLAAYLRDSGTSSASTDDSPTMPAHQCLGPDDRNGLEDRGKPSIQLDEEQAIGFVNSAGPRTVRCRTIS
jgi:hypothetical protein